MFLEQYWGGPTTYSDQRGHPRLRMRHAPFAVTLEARDRWLVHFREGLDKANLSPELDAQFWAYVQHAANFMVNQRLTSAERLERRALLVGVGPGALRLQVEADQHGAGPGVHRALADDLGLDHRRRRARPG